MMSDDSSFDSFAIRLRLYVRTYVASLKSLAADRYDM